VDATRRLADLRAYMDKQGIDLCIVMHPENQYYLSGFKAILYSRPIVFVIEGTKTDLIIPALEEEHAAHEANVDETFVYYEHPEMAHEGISYIQALDKVLSKYGEGKTVGLEFNVASLYLSTHLRTAGFRLADIGQKIAEMRYIKDENEIKMLEMSGEMVNLALKASLENARAGISELELDQFGNKALLEEVARKYPDSTVDYFVMSPSGVERTIMPHVYSNTRKLKQGDVIIHSRQVGLNGYRAENERTFFIGEPTKEQERLFNIAYQAQKAAVEAIRPGMTAAEVDRIARGIIQDAGYGEYFIHRTGHGIGIGTHEEPSLRFDSGIVLQEGMAFSIEPAIFVPGIGGFRHSDTVILTKDGARLITEYPRELKDLIF
jgi:Xaa-Pro dipeptidase